MPSPNNGQLINLQGVTQFREITVLTYAVENVFRKLVRMLVGRISLKKLQEMIQVVFLEETEAKLKKNSPGKNVSLSDLALLTGVDTRTIKKTQSLFARGNPIHKNKDFFDGYMPMFKIFNLWMNDERFFDKSSAKPKELGLDEGSGSFFHLVKLAMQSRGMSAQLILKRLQESGIISINYESRKVKLNQEDNIFISKDDLDSLEVGLAAIGNLADTVDHNINSNTNGEVKFFQRGSWDFQFNPENIDHIRNSLRSFLREKDLEARKLIVSLSDSEPQRDQVTAGVSMFYFEEKPNLLNS